MQSALCQPIGHLCSTSAVQSGFGMSARCDTPCPARHAYTCMLGSLFSSCTYALHSRQSRRQLRQPAQLKRLKNNVGKHAPRCRCCDPSAGRTHEQSPSSRCCACRGRSVCSHTHAAERVTESSAHEILTRYVVGADACEEVTPHVCLQTGCYSWRFANASTGFDSMGTCEGECNDDRRLPANLLDAGLLYQLRPVGEADGKGVVLRTVVRNIVVAAAASLRLQVVQAHALANDLSRSRRWTQVWGAGHLNGRAVSTQRLQASSLWPHV